MFRSRKTCLLGLVATISAHAAAQYSPEYKSLGNGAMRAPYVLANFGVAPVQPSVINYLDAIHSASKRYYRGRTEVDTNYSSQCQSLTHAENLYFQRGGFYQYGPNDCSMFVCDFLSEYTTTIPRRFTTPSLFSPSFMNNRGFVQVQNIYTDVQEYDVVVFRYYDVDFDSQGGHCGIAVWKNGKLCIEHNSSGNKGLAWTPIEEFFSKMARSPSLDGPHIFRWGVQTSAQN